MSRFIEVLADHGPVFHSGNVRHLLQALRERLDAETAHAEFEFPYFIAKQAPVTGATGLMDYTVRFQATLVGEEMDFVLTVVVPVTTLCPCSKAISESGAHNQRGHVTCSVRSETPFWIEDLVQMIESCASSELFSLLKRPDEKAVTERAYGNPVFVEDLVREVSARLAAQPGVQWFQVEAENFESIHNHNAYALVTGP
jgi:GTP cyclohydrolase I